MMKQTTQTVQTMTTTPDAIKAFLMSGGRITRGKSVKAKGCMEVMMRSHSMPRNCKPAEVPAVLRRML